MPKIVLVADDSPMVRKSLCQMFEMEPEYDLCAEAENGKEAIALAKEHRPDLIILDLSMPVMNGLEAAHELKRIMPEIPIILFTVHSDLLMNKIGHLSVDLVVQKTDPNLMSYVRSLVPAENASI